MELSSVAGMGGSKAEGTGKSALGKDEFLKLMMAQLSNQDPTSPADSQAFVAQLAQFANVEQLQSVNSQLETMLVAQASANQTSTVSLVGKDVQFKSTTLHLEKEGQDVMATGNLSADAASVTATITDKNGKIVRTIRNGATAAGAVQMPWDGKDDKGNQLPPGDYTVKLVAADEKGGNIPIDTRGAGRVTGVSFENGYAQLKVNGQLISLNDVTAVTDPIPPTTTKEGKS